MIADLDEFLADVARSAYGWPDSLRFTYEKTRELLAAGVPGDLVECGVGNGVHPAVMARACIDAGEYRTVRLFDSFQGVPNGGPHDVEWNANHGDGSGTLKPTGVAACSLDDVAVNLRQWLTDDGGSLLSVRFGSAVVVFNTPCVLHQGWFQESLPRYTDEHPQPIAFLRLDGDLYESTKVCLEHLYPLVSPGGLVVVDDLDLNGCRAAARDFGLDPDAFEPITASGDGWIRKP